MFSLLCQLASAFVGAVIPVFYSYKTIKKPTQRSLSYWSKYWTVFGSFLAVDAVLNTFFIHYFIPFYDFGKLMFLIWAVNPQTAGAQFVFDKVLAPFIHRHEKKMDFYVERMLDNVYTNGPSLALMAGTTLWEVAKNVHAASSKKIDADSTFSMQGNQDIVIAEVDNVRESRNQGFCKTIPALPVSVEVKMEPNSDDEVICIGSLQQKNHSKSPSPRIPSPARRKCTRRVTGNGVRKTNKNKRDSVDEVPGIVEDTEEKKAVRRPRRATAKAARKQQVLTEESDLDKEE